MREENAMSLRTSGKTFRLGEILQSQVPVRMRDAAALLFIHASTGGVNVVYRRGDDEPVRLAVRLSLDGEYPSWPGFCLERCEAVSASQHNAA